MIVEPRFLSFTAGAGIACSFRERAYIAHRGNIRNSLLYVNIPREAGRKLFYRALSNTGEKVLEHKHLWTGAKGNLASCFPSARPGPPQGKANE